MMAEADAPAVGLRLAAPAKINLTLHVTGRRPDGFHTLDSLVAFAGVSDRLSMEPSGALSLEVVGPNAEALETTPAEDNIVLRAARALAGIGARGRGARIVLHKSLPVAAGIGGGSADAAAALRGLCRLWDVRLRDEELLALAATLGADVPVCLRGRATQVGGIGEVLSDAPALPAAWLVLANPGVPLSTPEVFRARTGPYSVPAPLQETPRDAAELARALGRRRNDLTAAAVSLAPEVGLTLAALSALPGALLARMSGSGATCFALFATEYEARSAARTLRAAHPLWWTEAAPLLSETTTAGEHPSATGARP